MYPFLFGQASAKGFNVLRLARLAGYVEGFLPKLFLPRNTQDARSTGHFSGDEEEEEEEQDSKFFWREIQIFK